MHPAIRNLVHFTLKGSCAIVRATLGNGCHPNRWTSVFAWLILLMQFSTGPAWPVELPLEVSFGRQSNSILAYVEFDIPPDYHAYAHVPGPAGKPTDLEFVLEGSGELPAFYPKGISEPDIYDRNIRVNVYYGHTGIMAILPSHAAGKMYAATLNLLLCSNRHCIPVSTSTTGNVPGSILPLADMPWKQEALAYLESQGASSGALSLEEGIKPPPVSEWHIEESDSQAPEQAGSPVNEAQSFLLAPRYMDAADEDFSFWKALIFGVLAGLLLNAMPCVLPVLTLKVSGLLLMGAVDDKIKLRHFRQHNIFFSLGVLTFFTGLAWLLGIADMIWGQLYQNEAVLLIMLLLVFLMGLSMLGVFTLPMLDLRFKEHESTPRLNAYLTGLVSTFLATPCSGPLLGGVLAWAFLQPLPILMAVFWSVGVGMSLPYLVFSIWPSLSRILPRPGAWMHVFERLLGFLLLGTSIYLLSILPSDKYIQILCVLLLASVGAWLLHLYCGLNASTWRRRTCGIIAAVLLAVSVFWVLAPPPPTPVWTSYTPEKFAQDFGRQAMLVEFTADWCPNCKFLEATVLTPAELKKIKQTFDVELIKVDITHNNPFAEKLLEELGSRSIPLTAIFPAGPRAREPMVLRDLYSRETLEAALKVTLYNP